MDSDELCDALILWVSKLVFSMLYQFDMYNYISNCSFVGSNKNIQKFSLPESYLHKFNVYQYLMFKNLK